MAGRIDFKALVLAEGAEKALASKKKLERDLVARRDRLQAELREVEDKLSQIDQLFRRGCREAMSSVGVSASGELEDLSEDTGTNRQFVLAVLGNQTEPVKSRQLYDLAEKHGRTRGAIYVTVSKLIAEGVVEKRPLHGERGSLLGLKKAD